MPHVYPIVAGLFALIAALAAGWASPAYARIYEDLFGSRDEY